MKDFLTRVTYQSLSLKSFIRSQLNELGKRSRLFLQGSCDLGKSSDGISTMESTDRFILQVELECESSGFARSTAACTYSTSAADKRFSPRLVTTYRAHPKSHEDMDANKLSIWIGCAPAPASVVTVFAHGRCEGGVRPPQEKRLGSERARGTSAVMRCEDTAEKAQKHKSTFAPSVTCQAQAGRKEGCSQQGRRKEGSRQQEEEAGQASPGNKAKLLLLLAPKKMMEPCAQILLVLLPLPPPLRARSFSYALSARLNAEGRDPEEQQQQRHQSKDRTLLVLLLLFQNLPIPSASSAPPSPFTLASAPPREL
ncbi:hypothetical protein AXG93_4601s1150 [Marchantia polymorpha subsp. ruderalis]|uniref:Uncharacterized protein n=1 Tax=Marchantia polymorpha subsp. ruderalis TaxID=1480154 RepID=A0A176W1E1_MARPO|nr:hypothetical protein AXG93_4601s1150 [Marchantia polymorpha subsp. ruderalis]